MFDAAADLADDGAAKPVWQPAGAPYPPVELAAARAQLQRLDKRGRITDSEAERNAGELRKAFDAAKDAPKPIVVPVAQANGSSSLGAGAHGAAQLSPRRPKIDEKYIALLEQIEEKWYLPWQGAEQQATYTP